MYFTTSSDPPSVATPCCIWAKNLESDCLSWQQIVFAVTRCSTSPIAIGRTSPDDLGRAISRADDNNLQADLGSFTSVMQVAAK